MDVKYREEIVKSVRDDYLDRREERRNFECQWQLNTNFVMGNQFSYVSPSGEIEDRGRDYFWQEREVYNHISSIMEARLAKLARVRPKMSVRPATGEENDIRTAKVASKVLDGVWETLDLSEVISQATMWSELTGSAFYKISWDDDGGKRVGDGDNEIYEGEVRIEVCPPYEIFPSSLGTETVEALTSLIHAKAMNVDEIYSRWGIKVKPENAEVLSYDSSGLVGGLNCVSAIPVISRSKKSDVAMVIERYTKPTKEKPNGELAIVCGDALLYYGDLPFVNGSYGRRTFPFVKQDCLRNAGCFFGASVVERCIPVQRAYNSVKNRKHEFMNRIAMGVLAVEDGSVDIGNLEEEGLSPGKILVYRRGATPPMLMNPGSVPSDFNYEEDKLLSEFISISGVSEIMRTSSIPSSITSGTALQLLLDQDDTRLSITAERIRESARKAGQHILRLYKQFASQPRLLRYVGEDGEVEVLSWSASDIGCDDVVFDTENELNSSVASRQNMVFELLRSGLLFDENGKLSDSMRYKILDVMGYGGWEVTHDYAKLHHTRAQKENAFVTKKALEVNEMDDHEIHIEEHSRFCLSGEFENLCKKDCGLKEKLIGHIREHKQFMAAQKESERDEQR